MESISIESFSCQLLIQSKKFNKRLTYSDSDSEDTICSERIIVGVRFSTFKGNSNHFADMRIFFKICSFSLISFSNHDQKSIIVLPDNSETRFACAAIKQIAVHCNCPDCNSR